MVATVAAGLTLLSLFFIGFIAGAALQLQQPGLWGLRVYAVPAALGLVGLLTCWWFSRLDYRPGMALPVLLLALAFGFSLTGLRAAFFQAGAMAPALEGKDIEVIGRVLAMPQRSEDGLQFRFLIESARLKGQAVVLPTQIYLGWYAGFGSKATLNKPRQRTHAAR
jgi:competence protein ComEC